MEINDANIQKMKNDPDVREITTIWHSRLAPYNYVYNFKWFGVPIIQNPQDMIALQEIICETKPDLIIETGIAHGGSLIFSASILKLINGNIKYSYPFPEVLGIDIEIRKPTKDTIRKHPLSQYIAMIEGDSIDTKTIREVCSIAKTHKKIMVLLDSNHTHDHVLAELKAYAPLVSVGSYCVVFDTSIEDAPCDPANYKWGKGNNPKTAVHEYMKNNNEFIIDENIETKLVITANPDGWLKRVR